MLNGLADGKTSFFPLFSSTVNKILAYNQERQKLVGDILLQHPFTELTFLESHLVRSEEKPSHALCSDPFSHSLITKFSDS